MIQISKSITVDQGFLEQDPGMGIGDMTPKIK